MDNQLEFDLVSPLLGEPTPRQMQKVRTIMRLPRPSSSEQFHELRSLTARLNYLELVYDADSVSIDNELAQVRVLIGKEDWRKDGKLWARRARKNPLRLRKVILAMKKFWNLC